MSQNEGIALVTGAGSGIGRECALALVREGFQVFVSGRREVELKETAKLAASLSDKILPVVADVSDPESVKNLFDVIRKKFGRLDLLFNNAGVAMHSVDTHEVPFEDWNKLMDINVTGSFLCAQQALSLMLEQRPKGGRIINNGSVSAHVPRVKSVAYTVSKHAITGLTRSIALDYRNDNICCSQIDIGNAAVKRTEALGMNNMPQPDGSRRPEGQIDVSEVAKAVVFLAKLPLDVNVPALTFMANSMPYMGRG